MVLNKFSVAQNYVHRPELTSVTYYITRKLPILYLLFNFQDYKASPHFSDD